MELVTIRTFQNYFTAHILLTRLRDTGLPCFLKDEFMVTIEPYLSNAVGGIKLVVRKSDEAAAIRLLQEFDEAFRKAAVCPRCGCQTIEWVPKESMTNRITSVLTWLFGNYAISVKNVYHCNTCNYESDALPQALSEEDSEYREENLN